MAFQVITKRKFLWIMKVGDFIEHKMWVKGEILKIKRSNDDVELDDVFGKFGLKHLLVSFASIRKIS